MGLTEERIQKALTDPEADDFSEKERAALRYAEDLVRRRESVDDDRYDEMRRLFSDAEMVELGVFVGLCVGFDTLISTWGLSPEACEI